MDHLVAVIEKNSTEEIHVELSNFYGRSFVRLSLWRGTTVSRAPTGIAVHVPTTKIAAMVAALNEASIQADELERRRKINA